MSTRRQAIKLVFGSALVAATGAPKAQESTGPIRIVIPGPAGGGADNIARIVAEKLQTILGQTVLVDPRPGATGLIASKYVMSQEPNGQVLYLSSSMLASAPALDPELQKFDPIRDFTPIAQLTKNTMLFIVRSSLPVSNMEEFIAYCRQNPGKVSIGTIGPSSSTHLMTAYLAKAVNLDINIVHYKGSAPGNQDLMGGFIDARIDNLAGVFGVLNSGHAKAIAVAGKDRSPLFPKLKLVSETVPGLYFDDHFVIVGPAKMDGNLVEKLSEALRTVVSIPEVSAKLREQLGSVSAPLSPGETETAMQNIYESTKRMVTQVDLKP
ncbi:Bug family tripartite tricarboxylate transporter substrate binding protein [Bordetella tumulicola]|uniref:Bug family tripartite tricarboxylate transporter substrate binding protein n=1 Tax=Bordetella tumulicola TaxID=1649133 RepID=UPI0039F0C3F6